MASFWSDLDRAQAYLDACAERLLDPDDPAVLAWWCGEAASPLPESEVLS